MSSAPALRENRPLTLFYGTLATIFHGCRIKRSGGFVFGGNIAPIFFNTLEDSGALPLEMDVSALSTGMLIDLYPYRGEICEAHSQRPVTSFSLKTDVLLDEVRAGGRIPLIIGRSLTARARQSLNLAPSDVFRRPKARHPSAAGFTLAPENSGESLRRCRDPTRTVLRAANHHRRFAGYHRRNDAR